MDIEYRSIHRLALLYRTALIQPRSGDPQSSVLAESQSRAEEERSRLNLNTTVPVHLFVPEGFEMFNAAFGVTFTRWIANFVRIAGVILSPNLERVKHFNFSSTVRKHLEQQLQLMHQRGIVDLHTIRLPEGDVPQHVSDFWRISDDSTTVPQMQKLENNLQSTRVFETPEITVSKTLNPICHCRRTKQSDVHRRMVHHTIPDSREYQALARET